MPLYEYECKNCHHRLEKIVKFSDPPHTTCPKCGQEGLEQLLSAPAVQFKGSGWYVNDYARKSPSQESSNAKPAESKVNVKAESKPDSKPSSTNTSGSSSEKK